MWPQLLYLIWTCIMIALKSPVSMPTKWLVFVCSFCLCIHPCCTSASSSSSLLPPPPGVVQSTGLSTAAQHGCNAGQLNAIRGLPCHVSHAAPGKRSSRGAKRGKLPPKHTWRCLVPFLSTLLPPSLLSSPQSHPQGVSPPRQGESSRKRSREDPAEDSEAESVELKVDDEDESLPPSPAASSGGQPSRQKVDRPGTPSSSRSGGSTSVSGRGGKGGWGCAPA